MNRTLSYGAKLFAHLDPSKGVDALRQQDGGHGSRNPLRSVYNRWKKLTRTRECEMHNALTLVCCAQTRPSVAKAQVAKAQARRPHCGDTLKGTLHTKLESCDEHDRSGARENLAVSSQLQSVQQRYPQLHLTTHDDVRCQPTD
jgi:hypothetical protein